jgi:flagellar biosynthetic protein FliQ
MTLEQASDLVRQNLLLALTIAAPMLLIGLAVGLTISIVQAVTQIQEQTLTFVPKIAAMMISAALLMPWIGQRLLEYAQMAFASQLLGH